MKNILIAVRPQWVNKIVSGKKTIEVRKSAPQEVPFKCYIYETKGQYVKFTHGAHTKYGYGRGKVIGEFICDKIDKYTFSHYEAEYRITHVEQNAMCLNQPELIHYGKGEMLYGWHISDLKLYDSPKKLSEFYTKKKCNSCKKSGYESTACMYDEDCKVPMSITRAPQSWQYVGEVEQ